MDVVDQKVVANTDANPLDHILDVSRAATDQPILLIPLCSLEDEEGNHSSLSHWLRRLMDQSWRAWAIRCACLIRTSGCG